VISASHGLQSALTPFSTLSLKGYHSESSLAPLLLRRAGVETEADSDAVLSSCSLLLDPSLGKIVLEYYLIAYIICDIINIYSPIFLNRFCQITL